MVDELPDDVLIRRFAQGDEAAFVRLYRRHSPGLYGVLRRLVGQDEAAARDLLQDTWMRAASRLAAFRGDAQFRTWLIGIGINCAREWRRAGRREPAHLPVDDRAPAPDVQAADVERVLAGLPSAFREILVLHDVEGYTHDEIARLLGVEPGTSKSRLSRARVLFRRRWMRPAGAPHD
jgi:RNA polymerase sigma-70 factor (ECF subfamily)